MCHELESLVEAARRVQDESAVRDGLVEVSEGVSHALHLAVVVIDGEGALGESAELSVEEHGTRLAVVEELLLEAKPGGAGEDVVAVMDDVKELGGDGVEDTGHHHTVHTGPCGGRWGGRQR